MSHTHLPAEDVMRACRDTLHQIEYDRSELFESLVRAKQQRWLWANRKWRHACKLLTDEEIAMVEGRGAGVTEPVSKLHKLARAAFKINPSFTVEISVDDYALIAYEYERTD